MELLEFLLGLIFVDCKFFKGLWRCNLMGLRFIISWDDIKFVKGIIDIYKKNEF